jgi:hypothetical protein
MKTKLEGIIQEIYFLPQEVLPQTIRRVSEAIYEFVMNGSVSDTG